MFCDSFALPLGLYVPWGHPVRVFNISQIHTNFVAVIILISWMMAKCWSTPTTQGSRHTRTLTHTLCIVWIQVIDMSDANNTILTSR